MSVVGIHASTNYVAQARETQIINQTWQSSPRESRPKESAHLGILQQIGGEMPAYAAAVVAPPMRVPPPTSFSRDPLQMRGGTMSVEESDLVSQAVGPIGARQGVMVP